MARRASYGTKPRTGCMRRRRCSNISSAGASTPDGRPGLENETMNVRRLVASFLSVLALAGSAPAAQAQGAAWPDKPLHLIVSAGPGSSLDTLARVIGDKLREKLGQPVIVENKPAAGGTVATAEVAKAVPDGYTMLLGFPGPLAFGPLIQKLPYDVQRDLAPVIITSNQPNVL